LEFICFGPAVHLQRLQTFGVSISVDGVAIKSVDCLHDLGVGRPVFFHLSHLRRKIDCDVCQCLVSTLVLFWINYRNVMFAGLPYVTLAVPLCCVKNAVRFVASLEPRDCTSDAQRVLHWLPIKQRYTYKLCIIMHSVDRSTAPQYISDFFTPVANLAGVPTCAQPLRDYTTLRVREPSWLLKRSQLLEQFSSVNL